MNTDNTDQLNHPVHFHLAWAHSSGHTLATKCTIDSHIMHCQELIQGLGLCNSIGRCLDLSHRYTEMGGVVKFTRFGIKDQQKVAL